MKKYWHRISALHLPDIQAKTLQFITKTRARYNSSYHMFPWHEFTNCVPEILTMFDHLDMKVVVVAAYFMDKSDGAGPHRDATSIAIRAQIPICNTANTWTTFWEPKPDSADQVTNIKMPNGLIYHHYGYDHIVEQTRCEITEPTLIRPMEIHSVEADADHCWPRITLTLTVDPIPYALFPDIVDRVPIQECLEKDVGNDRLRGMAVIRPGYLR